MANSIPILKLSNGVEMSALGFGTFAKEGVAGKTHEAVVAALDAGYRHLDCAWYYLNEDEIGSALKEWLSNNPTVTRQDIFITTKVWPHLMAPADVVWSLNNSLANLGVDYVDSYLLHWPFVAEKTPENTPKLGPDGKYIINKELTENLEPVWRMMEKLYADGKTKSIGVSNWTISGLNTLLAYASIPPTVNQVEIHPFLPNTALIDYCTAHKILPVAYSPLGSQHQVKHTLEAVSTDPALNALAAKNGVDLAQILIAWGLQRGYAVLPKSSNPQRIRSNFSVIRLSDADMEAVNQVAEGRNDRFVNLKETFGLDVWPEESSK